MQGQATCPTRTHRNILLPRKEWMGREIAPGPSVYMTTTLIDHWLCLDRDRDDPTEDLTRSALDAIVYSIQTLRLHPNQTTRVEKYLRSEARRIGIKHAKEVES